MSINKEMPVNYGTSTQWSSLNVLFLRFLMTCKNVHDEMLSKKSRVQKIYTYTCVCCPNVTCA